MGILKDADLNLPCPNCSKETKRTWGWLSSQPEGFDCAHCGTHVVLNYDDAQGLGESLSAVDDSVAELQQTFEDINKRLKRGR